MPDVREMRQARPEGSLQVRTAVGRSGSAAGGMCLARTTPRPGPALFLSSQVVARHHPLFFPPGRREGRNPSRPASRQHPCRKPTPNASGVSRVDQVDRPSGRKRSQANQNQSTALDFSPRADARVSQPQSTSRSGFPMCRPPSHLRRRYLVSQQHSLDELADLPDPREAYREHLAGIAGGAATATRPRTCPADTDERCAASTLELLARWRRAIPPLPAVSDTTCAMNPEADSAE